jgi:hypothetical protein
MAIKTDDEQPYSPSGNKLTPKKIRVPAWNKTGEGGQKEKKKKPPLPGFGISGAGIGADPTIGFTTPSFGVNTPSIGFNVPRNIPLPGGGNIQSPGMIVRTPRIGATIPSFGANITVPKWLSGAAASAVLPNRTVAATLASAAGPNNNLAQAAQTPFNVGYNLPTGFNLPGDVRVNLPPSLAGPHTLFNNPIPGWTRPTERTGSTSTTNPSVQNQPTRLVRTGEGTGTPIYNPTNAVLPTGTFFSGGSPAPAPAPLPLYPTGTFFGGGGTMVQGPGGAPAPTGAGNGGGNGGYNGGYGSGGWSSGGGGGRRGSTYQPYTYQTPEPTWLRNLYNWTFKG